MEEYPIQPAYRAILAARQLSFDDLMKKGEIQPLVFPRDFLSMFIVVGTLLVPWPRHNLFRYARYLSFCVVFLLNTSTILKCRTMAFSNSYGVGLAFIWHTIWSATILVFHDVQRDFKRIERTFDTNKVKPNGVAVTKISTGSQETADVRHRITHSEVGGNQPLHVLQSNNPTKSGANDPANNTQCLASYHWQPYPKCFPHRLTWVFDVSILTFRGPGWNWGNRVLPPVVSDRSATKSAFRSALVTTLVHYMGLDLLKVILMKDPYFWGFVDSPPPPFFAVLGPYAGISAFIYRPLMCCLGVMFALKGLYGFACVVHLGIALTRGPRTRIKIPIEAPWFYPDFFGPFLSSILEGGLAGAWGRWWHQNFRFGFVSPADWIFSKLPVFLQTKFLRGILRLIIAFALSGIIHACGSYTQFAYTHPLSGSFLFFISQIPGILIQQLPSYFFPHMLARLPKWARQWSNLGFLIAWMLLTGPLVTNDFSRGGLWLFEPIPFSPLRGLGFGAPDEGWWCWHGHWFGKWKGERWWQRGVRIL